MSEHEQEQVDETRFDVAALRRAALDATATGDWMLLEDMQGELVGGRERTGIERPHVPIQIVAQVLDALVEDGRFEREEGIESGGRFEPKPAGELVRYRRKAEDRAATLRRREVIAAQLFPPPPKPNEPPDAVHAMTAAALVGALGAESIPATKRVVLEDLLAFGPEVGSQDLDGEAVFALREEMVSRMIRNGARAEAERTWPAEESAATGVVVFRDDAEALSVARTARAKVEAENEKLAAWIRKRGVSVEDLLGQPVATPRVEVVHTKSRPVDEAEKGRILDEILTLEKEIENVSFDATEKIKRLKKRIGGLKTASTCMFRDVSTPAYIETDWQTMEDVWYSVDGDEELERVPLDASRKKARAKALEEAATPAPVGAAGLVAAAPPAPAGDRPSLRDVSGSILKALASCLGFGGLTLDNINECLREDFFCPEGFESLVKLQLPQLRADGKVLELRRAGAPTAYLAAPEAFPIEPRVHDLWRRAVIRDAVIERGLTHAELFDLLGGPKGEDGIRTGGRYRLGPTAAHTEEFEQLVKSACSQALQAGEIRLIQPPHGQPARFALPTEPKPKVEKKAAPAPRAEESDDDEDDDLDDDVALEGDHDGADVQHGEEDDTEEEPPPAPPAKKGRRKKNPRTGQVSP